MIPGLDAIAPALNIVGKLIDVFDYMYKTRYARRYKKLLETIVEEEKKPIHGDLHRSRLRDQAKIDSAYEEINILLQELGREDDKRKRD